MELVIDKAGRIVIPKPVREELRLEAGDALELDREGEILRPTLVRKGLRCRKRLRLPTVSFITGSVRRCNSPT